MPVTLSGFAQKALLGSAFCFLALAFASAWGQDSQCTSDAYDLIAEVREVIDGDSVLLTDGRQVRFIGVNTPERAKEGRVAEPLADAARAALIGYLAAGIIVLRWILTVSYRIDTDGCLRMCFFRTEPA